MRRTGPAFVLCLLVSLSVTHPGQGQTPEVFKNRRLQVWEQMEPGSVMILRSRGSFGRFHNDAQDGNFYYLTGIDEPGAFLVLQRTQGRRVASGPSGIADREVGNSILFISPRNEGRAAWDALSWSWGVTMASSSPKMPASTWRYGPSCSAPLVLRGSAAPPPAALLFIKTSPMNSQIGW